MPQPRPFSAKTLAEFIADHPRMVSTPTSTSWGWTLTRWVNEDKHFTAYEADRRAVALGVHPSMVWDNWWDEALVDA